MLLTSPSVALHHGRVALFNNQQLAVHVMLLGAEQACTTNGERKATIRVFNLVKAFIAGVVMVTLYWIGLRLTKRVQDFS